MHCFVAQNTGIHPSQNFNTVGHQSLTLSSSKRQFRKEVLWTQRTWTSTNELRNSLRPKSSHLGGKCHKHPHILQSPSLSLVLSPSASCAGGCKEYNYGTTPQAVLRPVGCVATKLTHIVLLSMLLLQCLIMTACHQQAWTWCARQGQFREFPPPHPTMNFVRCPEPNYVAKADYLVCVFMLEI